MFEPVEERPYGAAFLECIYRWQVSGRPSKTFLLNLSLYSSLSSPHISISKYVLLRKRCSYFSIIFIQWLLPIWGDLSLTVFFFFFLNHSYLVTSVLGWVKIIGLNTRFNFLFNNGDLVTNTTRQRQIQTDFLLNLNLYHWNAWVLISPFKNGNTFITWGCKMNELMLGRRDHATLKYSDGMCYPIQNIVTNNYY